MSEFKVGDKVLIRATVGQVYNDGDLRVSNADAGFTLVTDTSDEVLPDDRDALKAALDAALKREAALREALRAIDTGLDAANVDPFCFADETARDIARAALVDTDAAAAKYVSIERVGEAVKVEVDAFMGTDDQRHEAYGRTVAAAVLAKLGGAE